jgi:chemotaxis protein CheD
VIVAPDIFQSVYLHPAQMAFCETPSRVETVLGSCVAVTMWDRRSHIGCICHAVLPRAGDSISTPFKYVDSSIRFMLELLEARYVRRNEIEVKLFGGANMSTAARAGRPTVGHQNVEESLAILAAEGFTLRTSDTGGSSGRKLLFYSESGEVFVKRIRLEAPR